MEGLPGVVLVQSLHYFPFILLNTAAALAGLDRSLEEAAQNLGSSGLRLYRRVLLPLALPGYAAGALLTFIRVIDDLGTPLMLNYTRLLAPQAYVRVTTIGLTDVDGYVICVILVALSLGALWLSKAVVARGEYAALGRGGEAPPIRLGRGRDRARVAARRAAAGPRAAAPRGRAAPVDLAGVEPLAAADRVHARPLRGDPRPLPAVHRQHPALRGPRGPARRGPGRGDRVAPGARPGRRPALARHHRHHPARHPRSGDRDRLPARLRRLRGARARRAAHLDVARARDRLRGAPAALRGARGARRAPAAVRPRWRRRPRTWGRAARGPSCGSRCR